MGTTRKRDLAVAVGLTAVVGYVLMHVIYRAFPPITPWTGVSLLGVAVAVAGWGFLVRARIRDGEIGTGRGRLHPLAVARSVVIAKASAWMGSVVLGWWLAVVVYLLPRRSTLRVAAEDTSGAVVAALCAFGACRCGDVAAALLQVARRPVAERRRDAGLTETSGGHEESPKMSTRHTTSGRYSRPMIDPTRGGRLRRGGRRPGWILMTVLLVLAIAASSALVFTNRVELLKLAVILALWAAVVAAFVSVIYRRQSDTDQAKVRDLKLVYDLQLDREISARREYELAVESQLRRELASELRAQSADEVGALRAELAALRANLEYLFDTDLSHRPAIETERTAGRVSSSRIDTEDDGSSVDDLYAPKTDESPIIDVPAEPHPPEDEWSPIPDVPVGAHRRAGEQVAERRHGADAPAESPWVGPPPPAHAPPPQAPPAQAPQQAPPAQQPPPPPPQRPPPQPAPQFPWLPPSPPAPEHRPDPQPRAPEPAPAASQWEPAPAEGQWIPPGQPGSNWVAPPANGMQDEYVGRRRAPDATSQPEQDVPQPQAEPPRGRHSAAGEQPQPPAAAADGPDEPDEDAEGGAHAGGQPVADLMARLHASPSGGGRRRRRED